MPLLLPGYSGTIWNAIRSTLTYAQKNLNTKALPAQTKGLARAIAATLKNGNSAIDVGLTYQGLNILYANLSQLLPIPLLLTPATSVFLANRVAAVQAAVLSIQKMQVQPGNVNSLLLSNQPVIPDPGFLEWIINSTFEIPPTFLTSANFVTQAQACANAWLEILNALRFQSVPSTGTMENTVSLMANAAAIVATIAGDMPSITTINANSPFTKSVVWNQLVFMPTILRCSSAIINDPTNATSQLTTLAKYLTSQALLQFNKLTIALRDVAGPQVTLGTLRHGDTLLTFSARETGNFENWRLIAEINGLQPPYITSVKTPTTAIPGEQLFLPAPGNMQVSMTVQAGSVPTYINNYLGIDKYFGQLNLPMLAWSGDYQVISGYDNLAISLGRRLQTVLGSLIYHPLFGSRIPPEVGSIASSHAAGLIKAYTVSALLSDPRVNKISSINVTLPGNYSVSVSATVLPNGLQQHEVTINEVLGPP